MRCIGLDLGSTYTKLYVIQDGSVIAQDQARTVSPLKTGENRYEIDGEAYFAQIKALLDAHDAQNAGALFISTQMHGCILTDARFEPVTPYISWQDTMGLSRLADIARLLGADAARPSGVPLKGNLALCALLSRRMAGDAWPRGAYLNTLGGYLIGRLTGEHCCHMTNAAPTGLADVRAGGWNADLIAHAGLEEMRFPRILTDLRPAGLWGRAAVYPDIGDQQVCALGANLRPMRDLHASIGTAGLIGCLSDVWADGAFENRPWLTQGLYLRTRSGLPGGRHLAALCGMLRAAAGDLCGQAPDEDAVWRYLGALEGTYKPFQGIWQDIFLTPGQAALCFYYEIARAFLQAAGEIMPSIERVAFSGGAAAKNKALRGAFSAAFGCDIDPRDHDAALGLCALAGQTAPRA